MNVGKANSQQITVLRVPRQWCDFCSKEIITIPPECKLIATGGWMNGPEYRLDPEIDTLEWWTKAKQIYGWVEIRVMNKLLIACRECNAKFGTANASQGAEPSPAGGTK